MKTRASQDVLMNMRAKADGQRAVLEKMKTFLAKFDGDFWDMVSSHLSQRITEGQRDRDNGLAKMTERELLISNTREMVFRELMALPKTIKAIVEPMEQEHLKFVESVGEYAEKLRAQ